MASRDNILQIIRAFQQETQGVILVAFVDLTASMTLGSSVARNQKQEHLDELAREATSLLNPRVISLLGNAPKHVISRTPLDTRVFVPSPNSEEALAIKIDIDAEVRKIAAKVSRLARELWQDQTANQEGVQP